MPNTIERKILSIIQQHNINIGNLIYVIRENKIYEEKVTKVTIELWSPNIFKKSEHNDASPNIIISTKHKNYDVSEIFNSKHEAALWLLYNNDLIPEDLIESKKSKNEGNYAQ